MTNEELVKGIRANDPGISDEAIEAQVIIVDAVQVLLNVAGPAQALRCLRAAMLAVILASSADQQISDALKGEVPN
jgi:hypothetical protein